MPDSKAVAQPAAKPAQSEPNDDEKPAAGRAQFSDLSDALQAGHKARTTVPGRPDVDARLDNRRPEDLESRTYGPDDEKPQHVDGPDVAGQVKHTRSVLGKKKS